MSTNNRKNVWTKGEVKWLQLWYVWNGVLHDIRQKNSLPTIHVRLVPYLTHDCPYLYSRTSVFVFVFEAIRIRIRIRLKMWKQIWFHWYPSVFDPITPLVGNLRTCFVETCVVYTHPPFPPFLSHKHRVGKPFGMEYLSDEPRLPLACGSLRLSLCASPRRTGAEVAWPVGLRPEYPASARRHPSVCRV